MDALQKEHERLLKRTKLPKSIDEVQKTIDLLKKAHANISEGMKLLLSSVLNTVRYSAH
jgi:hypothetical protein